MRISIMQPAYIPWLGFFELILSSDLFVLLDTVQYNKKSWRNRNRIRTRDGWMWLSVPVMVKGRYSQATKDVMIDNRTAWSRKHYNAIRVNYSRSNYFIRYFRFFEEIYAKSWENLVELDYSFINLFIRLLGLKTPVIRASGLDAGGTGNEHIVNICKALNADELYDSQGSKAFIDTGLFSKAGVKVIFQDYSHPVYEQVYRPFLPYMSVLDLLFNCGEKSTGILISGRSRNNYFGKR